MFGSGKRSEDAYRKGIELWKARDLKGAVEVMAAALVRIRKPDRDPWYFAMVRAIAQIHLETDDPASAGELLAVLPLHPVGIAQTLALRAKQSILMSDWDTAQFQVSAAIQVVSESTEGDLSSMRNGVIALADASEVLVDLGYGVEAERVVAMARARAAETEMTDAPVMGTLVKSAARAARLNGRPDDAKALLATLDTAESPDFEVEHLREVARLAWDEGDREAATELYQAAKDLALEHRYAALANDLIEEMEVGPPSGLTSETPVEEWVQVMEENEMADRSYAVVIEVEVEGDLDPFQAAGESIAAILEADPALGSVDGVGTDGQTWMLFLDGDDPEALWEAVRAEVGSKGWRGTVTVRQEGGDRTFPLGQS